MPSLIQVFINAYILLNFFSFGLMGRDKSLARRKQWRVPEAWFFTLAFLGGAPGVWFGMQFFRHKTQHKSFVFGIPALFVLNLGIVYGIWTLVK